MRVPLARKRLDGNVRTFNTMKLEEPAIEFRHAPGVLFAKSTLEERWYRVRGITKTLDTVICCRKRVSGHNMITMDLYTKVIRDLNENPDSALEWIPDYIDSLNAPESKGPVIRDTILRLHKYKALTPEACRRAWDDNNMSASLGTLVDAQCKSVYNGKRALSEAGPVARLVLTQLKALRLTPICAGLKVAGIPRPDAFGKPGRYTYHNQCTRGCTSIGANWGFYTEVDLVAHDTVQNTVALLELKTKNTDIIDQATLWRYNTQLWLTWVMFSLTYPSMAERSAAYLVIVRPGTNKVTMRQCLKPTLSKTLRKKFPWLNCFCSQVLECLAPTCVNMRIETSLARASSRSDGTVSNVQGDQSDLCYRNIMFNQEKAKRGARVTRTCVKEDK